MAKRKTTSLKSVETIKHEDAKRKNIPTAEHQSVLQKDQQDVRTVKYPRNVDLDPQLVWRGKDQQDWSDLVIHAPPLYIQEKVHPKVLIEDLLQQTKSDAKQADNQLDLFADFNGIPKGADKTEFYAHDQNWSNRMILGDSLQVMASLAEREGLRGKVQCIYLDPPYGIKFNSNFQWSTTSNKVTDGKADHITREPEQVKAFRDTWRDGIHSYLTYLRDRLTVARDLLSDSGSIYVQIGVENLHRIRVLMDEVFGEDNHVATISFTKTSGQTKTNYVPTASDYLVLYAKNYNTMKYRQVFVAKTLGGEGSKEHKLIELPDGTTRENSITKDEISDLAKLPLNSRVYATGPIVSAGYSEKGSADITVTAKGKKLILKCGPNRHWTVGVEGTKLLWKIERLVQREGLRIFKRYFNDFPYSPITNVWTDTRGETDMNYVVQTDETVIQRCILSVTDPGDLILDPTCGSGTTASVAELWGRRWITVDTSRVALALARARIMAARYPFYLLADSRDGQLKEAEITRTAPSSKQVYGNIRHGFVYERAPHITLGNIANNAELEILWDKWRTKLDVLRDELNVSLNKKWEEWEIPREADSKWSDPIKKLHANLWEARIDRQKEVDASIAAKADPEYLYDKPYEDKKKVRVAGPFTVESISPHRALGVDEDDDLIDPMKESARAGFGSTYTFEQMILENLKVAGVQQAHKQDKITLVAMTPWPGDLVCAEGRFREGDAEKRAAILIGPEFGTVSRPDLVAAAREAGDAGFDVLIACAFNYDAHASEFDKLGRIPVLKARMNADLHMADELKSTGKGNLFVIFGEPDIVILPQPNNQLCIKVNGVDVFDPSTGEVRSDGADGIACWFIDTDYNEESFFVRHAYFLGQNDPYSSLKTTLKAEINPEAWATLNSDTSRPFDKPKSGRIAVKVINHLGDEVMKVFKV